MIRGHCSAPTPHPSDVPDGDRFPQLAANEHSRLRRAALHAVHVYPGPAGKFLARELQAYDDFGYRLAPPGIRVLMDELVDDILARHEHGRDRQ